MKIEDLPDCFPEAWALRCLPVVSGHYDQRVLKVLRKAGYRSRRRKKIGADVFSPLLCRGELPTSYPKFTKERTVEIVTALAALVGVNVPDDYLVLLKGDF